MIELPKLTGREFRPWDWFGWIMSLWCLSLIYLILGMDEYSALQKVVYSSLAAICAIHYISRVAFGRVYKHVYYDTIIHTMYELKIGEDTYYVCAENPEELALYMDVHYSEISYTVVDEHVLESFYKKELYQ